MSPIHCGFPELTYWEILLFGQLFVNYAGYLAVPQVFCVLQMIPSNVCLTVFSHSPVNVCAVLGQSRPQGPGNKTRAEKWATLYR